MKREAEAHQKANGKFVPPADPLLARLPRVAEAVADLFWEDGTPREPWGLSLGWATGQCLLQLNDKERRRSLAVTAPSASEALLLLEELLGQPSLPWRYWSGSPKRGR